MNNKGFTLLELLLSLTILAIMTALVFGAFWTGIRSWEKSEEVLPVSQRLRVVPGLINDQLASICLPGVAEKKDGYSYFRGTTREMEFFSNRSLSPEYEQNIVYVRYRITGKEGSAALGFYEKDIYSLGSDKESGLSDANFEQLLDNFQSLSFSYLVTGKTRRSEPSWRDSWQPGDSREPLPLAVRIRFQKDEAESAFNLIVPLRVEL